MSKKKQEQAFVIQLKDNFQFIHEPVHYFAHTTKVSFVGRERELEELIQRILFSNGGSFLITGYRGVGKTSFVNHAIEQVKRRTENSQILPAPLRLLDIYMNLARPMTSLELIYHIIRSLYQELERHRLLHKLDKNAREALELAFRRTSVSITRSSERGGEINYDLSKLVTSIPPVSAVSGVFSGKVTRSRKLDISYLAYDEKSAEYDLIQIAKQIINTYSERRGLWRQKVQLKIIFVFDEIDKLELSSATQGSSVVDEMVGMLKNLFTTSEMFFIFIAGRDMHERLIEDINRGDSIYESVFAYSTYLPAMWGSTDAICEELLGQADEETLDRTILVDDRETSTAYNPNRNNIDQFKQYLAFQGRGIPRRILRSFNQYVRSHDNELALVFNRRDMRRIRFYAQLQALLVREDNRLIRYIHDEARGERRDKRMLGIYYLIDWILQQGDRPFTLAEAHAAVGRLNARIAPDSRVDEDIAQIAVALLLDYEYLEQDSPTSLPQFAKQSPAQIARYRIARRRLLEIGFEGNDIDTPFTSTVDGGRVFHLEQYQILEHFARGGFADIYRARHTVTAEEVAIKVPSATGNFSVIRRQFLHEIRLLQGVEHVHIIKLIEAGETNEKPYYVMPFIDGIMMSDIIQMQQRGNLDLLLTIIRPIVAAHSYLHQRNIVRTDVKPSNIMIDHAGHVWLIDLGIAIDKNNLDADIPISGTPRYAAPEQWESADIDARVDIFGLGVVMYEFLTGNVPFETTKMSSAKFSPIPDSHYFQLDPSIRGIIQRCLSIDAQARFADASELLKVLPSNEDVNLQASIAEVEAYQKQAEQYEDENTEGFFTQLYNPEESKQSIEPPEHVPAVSDEEHTMRPLLPVEEYSKTILRKAVRASKETYPTLYEGDPLVHDGPVLRFDDPQITVDAEVRDQYGLFYPLTSDKTVRIGRSLENDISVDNKKVSRYQAMIYWKSDAFIIEDANSYECTRLNSDVIDKPTRLSDGNEIKIDKHTLTYWAKRTNPPTIIN